MPGFVTAACCSCRAYLARDAGRLVFDAHDRAFASVTAGACIRGIYDNMKTAVETILVGKDRVSTIAAFLQMCSHYLVGPWSLAPYFVVKRRAKSRTRVGTVRERFSLTPRAAVQKL